MGLERPRAVQPCTQESLHSQGQASDEARRTMTENLNVNPSPTLEHIPRSQRNRRARKMQAECTMRIYADAADAHKFLAGNLTGKGPRVPQRRHKMRTT